jgi:hypothetical protein
VNQADLNRAVARAMGETVSTVKQRGFGLVDPNDHLDTDPGERAPYVIDWDALETSHHEPIARRPHHEPTAT